MVDQFEVLTGEARATPASPVTPDQGIQDILATPGFLRGNAQNQTALETQYAELQKAKYPEPPADATHERTVPKAPTSSETPEGIPAPPGPH